MAQVQIFSPKPADNSREAIRDKARDHLRIYAISIGRRDLVPKIMVNNVK